MWTQDDKNPESKGFFAAETKVRSCPKQSVHISEQAAEFMLAKSITCSKTHDDFLRFELPQSASYAHRIKVDCDSKLVELRSDGSSLEIITIEANGGGNLATVNSWGKWDGNIQQMARGVSAAEMSAIQDDIHKVLKQRGRLVYSAGDSLSLLTASFAAALFAPMTLVSLVVAPLIVGISAPIALAAIVYVGHGLYKNLQVRGAMAKNSQYLSLLAHESVSIMLRDFKAAAEQ